jgi:insulin-like growth factor-binding protein complex acid labile subunit
LYLEGNQIKEIEGGTLSNLPSLSELSLSENKIEQVKAHYFQNIPSLIKLQLEANRIIIIQTNSFSSLTNLEKLLLTSNSIGELKSGAFNGLLKQSYLRLSHNDIETFSANYFLNLSIQSIVISNAKLKRLQEYVFVNMSTLKILELNGNQISYVSDKFYWLNISNPLRANIQLQNISFNENRITSLSFTNKQF